MLEAISDARGFADGRMREHLETDRMLLLAILKSIEIIGEAAAQVTHSTRQENPAIPWQEIVSMRNRLIHGYVVTGTLLFC